MFETSKIEDFSDFSEMVNLEQKDDKSALLMTSNAPPTKLN